MCNLYEYKRHLGLLLLTAILAGPAHGQTRNDQTASAQTASSLTCGVLKAESSRTASTSGGRFRTLGEDHGKRICAAGPRFECIEAPSWSWSSPRRRDIRLRAYFRRRTDISYAASRSTPRQSLRSSIRQARIARRSGRVRSSLSSQYAGRSIQPATRAGLRL